MNFIKIRIQSRCAKQTKTKQQTKKQQTKQQKQKQTHKTKARRSTASFSLPMPDQLSAGGGLLF
jgi:hypothetical protein